MYHYAGNNPVKYEDPDGKQDFLSYLYQMFENSYGSEGADYIFNNDSSIKFMCTVDAAANGDPHAQKVLKYAFHEASREMLVEISEKSGYASLAFLAVGCPEGAAVFGAVSTAADGLLAVDNFITALKNSNGDYSDAFKNLAKDGAPIVGGLVFSAGAKAVANGVSKSINITVGSTGRYYEIGHRGAIKSEKALRKIIAKDIASGYFGQEVVPNAPSIIDQAVKIYRKLNGIENEN